jgi:hypothetical protein
MRSKVRVNCNRNQQEPSLQIIGQYEMRDLCSNLCTQFRPSTVYDVKASWNMYHQSDVNFILANKTCFLHQFLQGCLATLCFQHTVVQVIKSSYFLTAAE